MNRETTKIDLPPPRMIKPPRKRASLWLWVVLVGLALGIGAGGGLWFGLKRSQQAGAEEQVETTRDREIARLLAEARVALAEGGWFEARRIYEQVREIDPDNPEALVSLPIIDRHLDEVKGSLVVATDPTGATVQIPGVGKFVSPTTVTGLPLGEHTVTISMDGFEAVERPITIVDETPISLADVSLKRTAGQLEVVSEPRGAEFKLLKTIENNQQELVEVGSTPALFPSLDPGEYEVHMAVEGWPEFSEKVKVENNRNASVSAVFAKGGLKVTSDPSGAEVWIRSEDEEKENVGRTPLNLGDLPVGRHQVEVQYGDWTPIRRTAEVVDGVTESLDFAWERTLVSFQSDPPGATVFSKGARLGNGSEVTPFRLELPEGDYRFSARHPKLGELSQSFYVDGDKGSNEVKFGFAYGTVGLTSVPSGATVVSNGVPIGRTPLTLPVVPPGAYSWELRKEAHRSKSVSGTVEAGSTLNFTATLPYDPAPVTSRSFRNGLGQDMVWIGELNGWAAAHETTQAQFERLAGENPSYFKAPNHPVDSVTWYKAVKFCEALTVQEQGLGNLPAGYRYRLPTDAEWTKLVGGQKLDGAISSRFDRKSSTAPVGSLAPNQFGLYDVRGNVWEWVSDWYSQRTVTKVRQEGATPRPEWVGTDRKVLRGGAWNRSSQFDLAIANRMAARPSAEDRYDVGFRVVLMPE